MRVPEWITRIFAKMSNHTNIEHITDQQVSLDGQQESPQPIDRSNDDDEGHEDSGTLGTKDNEASLEHTPAHQDSFIGQQEPPQTKASFSNVECNEHKWTQETPGGLLHHQDRQLQYTDTDQGASVKTMVKQEVVEKNGVVLETRYKRVYQVAPTDGKFALIRVLDWFLALVGYNRDTCK